MGTLRLTLLRHGHAQPIASAADDFERQLTARGRVEATGVGARLLLAGLVPDLVLASSARRTQATAQLMAAACSMSKDRLECRDELYNASAEAIWQVVATQAGRARHVLVVGHNPGISELASRLAAGTAGLPRRVDLPPAGLVTATWNHPAWGRLEVDDARDAQQFLP